LQLVQDGLPIDVDLLDRDTIRSGLAAVAHDRHQGGLQHIAAA
jgi:hypothetical protein